MQMEPDRLQLPLVPRTPLKTHSNNQQPTLVDSSLRVLRLHRFSLKQEHQQPCFSLGKWTSGVKQLGRGHP